MGKRKPAPFRIVMRIKDQFLFAEESKVEALNEWIEQFNRSTDAVELSVYQQNGLGYDLMAYENKRKIGF